MKVIVCGCGFAGAAAAIALHDAGHAVELRERFDAPSPVGAGILLQPTGLAVLRALGLEAPVLARGARVDRLHGTTQRGRPVLDLHYGDWRAGAFGIGLQRSILFDTLWEALTARGIPVRTGTTVRSLNGIDADLVLICDGARSWLRSLAGLPVKRAVPYPWGALWGIVDDPEDRYAGALRQVYRGTHEMLGFLPSGRPDGATPRVSVFWSLPAARAPAVRAAGLDAFKARVRRLTDLADPVLDRIESMDQLLWAGYQDVVLERLALPANGRRAAVAVVGDAAHAMSPQLGQGTNLALLDAWVLADSIATSRTLDAALERYTLRRKAHLRYYAWASRLLTPAFQSHLALLGPPRDLLAAPLARVPWLRDQMLGSLAGAKTGLWGVLDDSVLTDQVANEC